MARAKRDRVRDRVRDPVRLEVFHHLFASTAEEMGVTLQRSSFSPNIKERRDFSCALFDARARMIGQAAHLPVHLGSAPMSVEAACRTVEMGPGDAVVLNDPYLGGTHLPDVTLVSPVFLGGGSRPAFYCANRAHHADVGGGSPGSMAPAFDVHGEGLRIPPVHLVRGGELVEETLRLLLANMRVPSEREGDLLAQWSANRIGERRVQQMAAEYGRPELEARAASLMDWTEALMRAALTRLPSRSARFRDELELAGGIEVELALEGDRLVCDFTRTDDQVDGPWNTVRAVVISAVMYVLRLLLPPGTPTNDGILRCVEVRTRPGSLVDARYPAPVAAGNVEASQRIVDVLFGALAKLDPKRVPAASSGTMSNLTFGANAPTGETFTYYETIAGGAGAGPTGAGEHGVHTHMTNTRNTPIEAFERHYPVRLLRHDLRRNSGGAGRHRGGEGIVKRLRFLAPARVAWLADRQRTGAWGLAGGDSGRPGGAWVSSRDGAGRRRLGGEWTLEVDAGAELEVHTPGGGGYGRKDSRAPIRPRP